MVSLLNALRNVAYFSVLILIPTGDIYVFPSLLSIVNGIDFIPDVFYHFIYFHLLSTYLRSFVGVKCLYNSCPYFSTAFIIKIPFLIHILTMTTDIMFMDTSEVVNITNLLFFGVISLSWSINPCPNWTTFNYFVIQPIFIVVFFVWIHKLFNVTTSSSWPGIFILPS